MLKPSYSITSAHCNKYRISDSFGHDYGLIPLVGKFSRGHSLRLIFPKGGVAHNHD